MKNSSPSRVMRACLRETACSWSTTSHALSRPRVIDCASRTCSVPVFAPPSALRCLTTRRTLISSERTGAHVLLTVLDLRRKLVHGRELEEVAASDGRLLVPLVLLEQQVQAVVAHGVFLVQLEALLERPLLLGLQPLLPVLQRQLVHRRRALLAAAQLLGAGQRGLQERGLAVHQRRVLAAGDV